MSKYEFITLDWDSNYFDVSSAKIVLKESLLHFEWDAIKEIIGKYRFVTIVNNNSNPMNSMMIGKNSNAYLVDVNIQFKKTVDYHQEKFINVNLIENKNVINVEDILEIIDFPFSRFIDDPNIPKEKSQKIYKEWVRNSLIDEKKSFIISKNELGKIDGFILFSINIENEIVIELISVLNNSKDKGTGTKMFKTLENHANSIEIKKIVVGTQVKNMRALNFYHKLGFKQIECHQIFHLWN